MELKIQECPDGEHRYYVFTDVAELFWPGDFHHGNHDAENRVVKVMTDAGCTRVPGTYCGYSTPHGPVYFDSESGCFECHAPTRAPVGYVVAVIEMIKAELDHHREALKGDEMDEQRIELSGGTAVGVEVVPAVEVVEGELFDVAVVYYRHFGVYRQDFDSIQEALSFIEYSEDDGHMSSVGVYVNGEPVIWGGYVTNDPPTEEQAATMREEWGKADHDV